ncbi:MAG: DNA mismatch repair endonuclease MutL [Ignavibacteriales bacterium]|nr:DNA mismatch repair endonuclease MutL [Ignavibacteriales bacterium]
MSKTIKILPEHLANKIAAGEVIQRPASAVKELIENSIDAHSKTIKIIIKDGGKELIQVVDDGDGMSADDASVAFHRHATSKIETYEDLEAIKTLGFRGEALSSIAAVSQVELRARRLTDTVGIKVRIYGGKESQIGEDACSPGTSITMKNIFFNTPARRNFLKNKSTEYRHIYDVVQRCALSHPNIAFLFHSDNEIILNLRRCELHDRLKDLFGEAHFKTLMPVNSEKESVAISGYVGQPQFAKRGKAEQFLFLNNRYIVSKNLNHAVYQAYEHLVEKGTFPFFIIFISIDPRKIDVNVHPTKMEVKFDDEPAIYKMIMTAVRATLGKYEMIPQIHLQSEISQGSDNFTRLSSPPIQIREIDDLRQQSLNIQPSKRELTKTSDDLGASLKGLSNETVGQSTEVGRSDIRQLNKKYILYTSSDGLMIIDQHAAHERILYEKFRARLIGNQKTSQQLLFPQTLQLNPGDLSFVKELQVEFESLGFSIKFFGKTTIIIDGVPPEIKAGNEAVILQDVLSLYKDDRQEINMKPSERLAKSLACKAAVKAGDLLTYSEMTSLIEQLATTSIPTVCPHGRPVSMKLTIEELDRRFGRTS